MATDAKNLKITRVTSSVRTQFLSSVPAAGSIYFDLEEKVIRIGDGSAAGGVSMVNESHFNEKLSTKVDNTDFGAAITSINNTLNTKANQSDTTTALNTKLDRAELETAMRELITEWGGTPPA